MMVADGNMHTTRMKFRGTIIPAYMPKDRIGMIGLNTFARKAAAVVLLVMAMARVALL